MTDATFERALKSCGNGKYTDNDFKADRYRLIPDWDDIHEETQALIPVWNTYKWLRTNEIPSLNDDDGKLEVFAGAIEPTDIKQGALGNCYFLSAISVLTEHPKRVRKMFVKEEITK